MVRIFSILVILMAVLNASQPNPQQQTGTYQVFMPVIMKPALKYGLAMAHPEYPWDLDNIGAQWWYDWRDGAIYSPGYVPMLWSGNVSPNLPADYDGYILFLNEPNVSTQANLTPAEGAMRYARAAEYYKNAKFVVGGTSIFANLWLSEFVVELAKYNVRYPYAYHIHTHIEEWVSVEYIKNQVYRAHQLTASNLWITEVCAVHPHTLDELSELVIWLDEQDYIERIAVYTNRQLSADYDAGWALNGCDLVNSDGTLTPAGMWYRDFISTK